MLDPEPAAELISAALGDDGEGCRLCGRGVEADDQAVAARTAADGRHGDQSGQQDNDPPPYASAPTRHRTCLSSVRTVNSLRNIPREAALDSQASQQIPGLFRILRITQHVVAAGHQLQSGTEVAGAASHRVGNRRCDQPEEHAGD